MRVLVVDEHADAANSLTDLLKLLGADARVCLVGTEAESLANAFRPHVWVIEPRGRGWDGFEFARRVRAVYGERPLLVALSVLAGPDAAARAAAAGFDFHIAKPADPCHVVKVLAEFAWRATDD